MQEWALAKDKAEIAGEPLDSADRDQVEHMSLPDQTGQLPGWLQGCVCLVIPSPPEGARSRDQVPLTVCSESIGGPGRPMTAGRHSVA